MAWRKEVIKKQKEEINKYYSLKEELEMQMRYNDELKKENEKLKKQIHDLYKGEMKDIYTDNGTYKKGINPEVTCWHCNKTFLCDCMDACCRLCSAPYDKTRCKEFNFIHTDGGE